jgi:hypothetical protein
MSADMCIWWVLICNLISADMYIWWVLICASYECWYVHLMSADMCICWVLICASDVCWYVHLMSADMCIWLVLICVSDECSYSSDSSSVTDYELASALFRQVVKVLPGTKPHYCYDTFHRNFLSKSVYSSVYCPHVSQHTQHFSTQMFILDTILVTQTSYHVCPVGSHAPSITRLVFW